MPAKIDDVVMDLALEMVDRGVSMSVVGRMLQISKNTIWREARRRRRLELEEDEKMEFGSAPTGVLIPLAELLRPTKLAPGSPERLELDRQREWRGIMPHVLDNVRVWDDQPVVPRVKIEEDE
jgi:hypothetical protein